MAETSSRSKRTRKRLRFTIEYTTDIDLVDTESALDKLREYGEAEVVDVVILDPSDNGEG